MSLFVKWFALTAGSVMLGYLAFIRDLHEDFYGSDETYITYVISALYVIFTMQMGHMAFDISREQVDLAETKEKLKIASVWAAVIWVFGLGGTFAGMAIVINAAFGGSVEPNPTELINAMGSGMNTAIYTTIAGMLAWIGITLQTLLIRSNVEGGLNEEF